jgi:hypothetical protein
MRRAAALLLAGCAFGAGGPYARVDASFEARLAAPPDRDAGDGWQRLSNYYQVRLTTAVVELGAVELVAAGGAGGAFDPANPPPGYSLCHGGHCHADDGRLVSYEDIAAELAGGAAARVVLRLDAPGTVDLVAGASRDLGCGASCDLPRGSVGLIRVPVTRLAFEGRVRDPLGRIEERALSIAIDGGLVAAQVSLPADREHDPGIRLTLRLELGAPLLDGYDFAAGGDLAAHLERSLAETTLTTEIER